MELYPARDISRSPCTAYLAQWLLAFVDQGLLPLQHSAMYLIPPDIFIH